MRLVGSPYEPAADGPTELDRVADSQIPDEERRHLTAGDGLYRQLDLGAVVRSGERVAALGRVTVGGREPNVDVLPSLMSGPTGDAEHERRRLCRLLAPLDQLCTLPGEPSPDHAQSPA